MSQKLQSSQFFQVDGQTPDGGTTYGPGLCIAWQRGPLGRGENREEPNGCFVETVIQAAVERLEFYQRSKFSCGLNAEAIQHLNNALLALQRRTDAREQRGVEGTHEV